MYANDRSFDSHDLPISRPDIAESAADACGLVEADRAAAGAAQSSISMLLGHSWPERDVPAVSAPLPAQFGAADIAEPERALVTLLFTDIVGSTERAERLGDEAWYALLSQHHAIVRRHLANHGGKEIDTAGDGFFATFERPSCAVRCAASVRTALKSIGVDIRSGVHAGECEVARGRVVGVAVHVAARVAHVALAGEILVSSTVRDLLAGSTFHFTSRDWQSLKGLSESRQLFAFEA